jgi:hypothetical protein
MTAPDVRPATVTYIPCATEEAVNEAAARWTASGRQVQCRWNPDEVQHEARLLDEQGCAVQVHWWSPSSCAPVSTEAAA